MQRVTDNLDIVVFALILGLVVWVLGAGIGLAGDRHRDAAEALGQAESSLESVLAERRYEDDPGLAVIGEVLAVPTRARANWLPPSDSVVLPAAILHHPDALADQREGRDLALRFSPPVDLVADATPGLVRLAWTRPDGDTVEAIAYRVYRRTSGGEEQKIAEVRGHLGFEDRQVEPGRSYVYRVSALTEDPVMVSAGRAESSRTPPVEARAARDFSLLAVAAAEDGGSARFMVKKLANGIWYEKEFEAARNLVIGTLDPGTGVDYATQCTFLRIVVETKVVPEERDEVRFDPEGRVVLEGGQPVTRRVAYERRIETRLAVVRNELGDEERVSFAAP